MQIMIGGWRSGAQHDVQRHPRAAAQELLRYGIQDEAPRALRRAGAEAPLRRAVASELREREDWTFEVPA